MTKLQLSADEYRLFIVIPEDGTSVGNVTAQSMVGFAKGRCRTAKDGLLDKRPIVRAMVGGGAIKRDAVAESSDIEMYHVNGVGTVKPPVAESKLYERAGRARDPAAAIVVVDRTRLVLCVLVVSSKSRARWHQDCVGWAFSSCRAPSRPRVAISHSTV